MTLHVFSADELKQYRTMTECDKLRQELEAEKQKRKQLEHELKEKNKRLYVDPHFKQK